MVVVAGVAARDRARAWPVLVVVLALVAMVMLHELGHFATAKWSGMKVTEYFLGFGPRLWSIRRGETEYGVKAIPAGGYVRIVGMTMLEEVDPVRRGAQLPPGDLPAASSRRGRRLADALHHGLRPAVLAVCLLGRADRDGADDLRASRSSRTGQSPAQRAGLRPGDTIVAVDGHKYTDLDSLHRLRERAPGTQLTFVVRRDGHDLTLPVTPVDGRHVVEESRRSNASRRPTRRARPKA